MIAAHEQVLAEAKQRAPHRPPGVLIYVRASTGKQFISPSAQLKGCLPTARALNMPLAPEHYPSYNPSFQKEPPQKGVFIDSAASAFKTPFALRPAGKKLLASVVPGDRLVVWRFDRIFRSMEDFCEVIRLLELLDVKLVVCSPPIDMTTANGRMMARQLVNMAEWESDRKGERVREAIAQKKLVGDIREFTKPTKAVSMPSDYRPVSSPELYLPQKPGRIYIYVRCSHRDSVDSGLGMGVQVNIANAYAETLIAANPGLYVADTFYELGVSAYSKRLRKRKMGMAMDKILKEGDHVIFSVMDRGFRSIRDMANTIPDWRDRGIETHFAADRLCMSDPSGEMMATAMVMFAQMEAKLTSDRTREAKAFLSAQGMYLGGLVPGFWKIAKFGKFQRLILDRRQLAEYRLIMLYIHTMKMTRIGALNRLESLLAKRECRPMIPESGIHRLTKLAKMIPDHCGSRHTNGKLYRRWTELAARQASKQYEAATLAWQKAIVRRKEEKRRLYSEGAA